MIVIKIIAVIVLLIILLFIYGYILDLISAKKHKSFLESLNGKSLYISTNKKDFSDLNELLITKFNQDIIQVKLIAGNVNSTFDADKIHRLISQEKLKNFPIAIIVKNNKLIHKSFYSDFKIWSKEVNKADLAYKKITEWYDNQLRQEVSS